MMRATEPPAPADQPQSQMYAMAKTLLLDTRTTNFLELIGNGKIYRVPLYQRDYSWTEEQWEDLWNDLYEMHGREKTRHYMGALVY